MTIYKRGIIESLPAITVSDPWYKDNVSCRYNRKRIPKEPFEFICHISEQPIPISKEDLAKYPSDFIETLKNAKETVIKVLIKRESVSTPKLSGMLKLDDSGVLFSASNILNAKSRTIGMDTARLYIGRKPDEYSEVLHSGADGIAGSVFEYTIPKGKKAVTLSGEIIDLPHGFIGIYIDIGFDANMVTTQQAYNYLVSQFDVKITEN